MDFFLDSGIFIGLCDPKDKFNGECKKLFEKYPRDTNNYYSAKIVEDELSKKRLKHIKRGYDNTVLRRIHQCIERWIEERMNKLVEYENKNYTQFNPLYVEIRRLTDYKEIDAIIVTNAIFWSCKCDPNEDPTLVTVDYYDIVQNADKIIETAKSRCDSCTPLTIKAVWEI